MTKIQQQQQKNSFYQHMLPAQILLELCCFGTCGKINPRELLGCNRLPLNTGKKQLMSEFANFH